MQQLIRINYMQARGYELTVRPDPEPAEGVEPPIPSRLTVAERVRRLDAEPARRAASSSAAAHPTTTPKSKPAVIKSAKKQATAPVAPTREFHGLHGPDGGSGDSGGFDIWAAHI